MSQPALSFKDRLSIALLSFFGRLPLPFLQRLGRWLGQLASALPGLGPFPVVLRNLQLCFPEKTGAWHEETARKSMISTGMTAFEFARTWIMPPDYSVAQIREVHGGELFHDALASGRGVIGIVPHWGTWEFMNAWVNQYTSPVIMYKPGKQPGVDALVALARSRLRATVVPADETGVRATFKALRQGGFSAILPDHTPTEAGGVQAPFFGIMTRTAVIVPKLAAKTGCAVIIMGCVRRADGDGFDMQFLPADPDVSNPDVAVAAAAMNRSMEALIRMAPEQYQWTYKRFKHNATLANPYRFPD